MEPNAVRIERRGKEREEASAEEGIVGDGDERVVSPLFPSPQRRLLPMKLQVVVSLAHISATAGGIGP